MASSHSRATPPAQRSTNAAKEKQMSKSSKSKSSSSTKSAKSTTADVTPEQPVAAPATAEPVIGTPVKRVNRVRFYEALEGVNFTDLLATRKGQLKSVIAALVADPLTPGTPVRGDELQSSIESLIAASGAPYKTKTTDIYGSIGFHLHQLARAGYLREFDAVKTEDGGWEVVSYAKPYKTE